MFLSQEYSSQATPKTEDRKTIKMKVVNAINELLADKIKAVHVSRISSFDIYRIGTT